MQVDAFEDGAFRRVAKDDVFKGDLASEPPWSGVRGCTLRDFGSLVQDFLHALSSGRGTGEDVGQLGKIFHGLEEILQETNEKGQGASSNYWISHDVDDGESPFHHYGNGPHADDESRTKRY